MRRNYAHIPKNCAPMPRNNENILKNYTTDIPKFFTSITPQTTITTTKDPTHNNRHYDDDDDFWDDDGQDF